MDYCNPYLAFQSRARREEVKAKQLYLKTSDPRVLTEAKKKIGRLANEYLHRLPGRHCQGATCVLTEWQRILTGFEELATREAKETYQARLAEVQRMLADPPRLDELAQDRVGLERPVVHQLMYGRTPITREQ